MKYVLTTLRNFIRDPRGTLSVETALIFPLMIVGYVMMFTYFEAYNTKNTNVKAGYTIADMVSRNREITPNYLTGLNKVFDYLTNTRHPTWLRISSVQYQDSNSSIKVLWSHATKGKHTLMGREGLIRSRVPTMADMDTVVIIETGMAYEPSFKVGLDALEFTNFVITRPRYDDQVTWEDGT